MIVARADLDEALERAAELDAALRRHPHDEGLRQRLRTVVAQIRRIARGGFLAPVVLVALGACAVPQPLNEEVDAPPAADDAAAVVVQEWSERLPHATGLGVDDLPPIRWFGPAPNGRACLDNGGAMVATEPCPIGTFVQSAGGGEEIHVLVRPTMHETVLAHEVLHFALDETTGEPDSDHRGTVWGDELAEVFNVLARAGL